LFCCWVEILNRETQWIFFLFQVFGQLSPFTDLLTGKYASSCKRFLGWHFDLLERKKLASSNVVTSSWVRSVLSYIGHKEGTTGLPIVHFLIMPPTQKLWYHDKSKTCVTQLSHLWQHSNYQHNKEQEYPILFPLKWFLFCNNMCCPFAMLNIRHWTWGYIVQCAKHHHHKQNLNTSSPLWVRIGKPSCERLDCLTSPLGVDLCEVNSTHEHDKFTWSCLCESPFDSRGKFFFCLTNPNTSSPSKCGIFDVYEKLEANMVIVVEICNGSLD
jgi:hypothetical protein